MLYVLWRLGHLLARRRESFKALSTAGAIGAGAAIWGGMATGGLSFIAAWLLWDNLPGKVPDAARWLRFGREYAEPAVLTAERASAVMARLQDRRGMRASRLYFLLAELPAETLIYVWGTGDDRARERIGEYVRTLAPARPAVTGEDLIELGLTPGPGFSGILAQARADRLDGKAVGREAELANLRRLAKRETR